ncbi:MAG: hypothetical protein PHG93_02615 [Candidatus Methanomethylophilaceae archaeon]|nr:hypothetical protein [Candidatus Methanomethylophilaceae archaeon]
MIAFRENENAKYIDGRHFTAALKVVKPSVDAKAMERYAAIGTEMRKRRTGYEAFYR